MISNEDKRTLIEAVRAMIRMMTVEIGKAVIAQRRGKPMESHKDGLIEAREQLIETAERVFGESMTLPKEKQNDREDV